MKRKFAATLQGNGLEIRKPIRTVTTMISASRFMASAPELKLFLKVIERNREKALVKLAGGIADQYWLLKQIPKERAFPRHKKILGRLRRYLRETPRVVCSKNSLKKVKKQNRKKTRK